VNPSHPVATPIQLAATLRALRKSRGLTQEAVGRLLGVSQKRVAWIESVPGRTSFDQISRLVSSLGGRIVIEVSTSAEGGKATGKGTRKPAAGW
jgi:HTH-type transcriptional regulator/antitoxin HipB